MRLRVATGTPQQRLAEDVERGVGLRRPVFGRHQRGLAAGMFEGEHCGVADEFGADHGVALFQLTHRDQAGYLLEHE